MNHTSTPWRVAEEADLPFAIICDDELGEGIIEVLDRQTPTEQQRADFEHIVKCVNHHDELVDAARTFRDYIDPDGSPRGRAFRYTLDAILAKLEGAAK